MFSAPQFYEGYGQTECTAGCTMSMPGDWSAGKSYTHPLTVALDHSDVLPLVFLKISLIIS